jgi:hypothetical protein
MPAGTPLTRNLSSGCAGYNVISSGTFRVTAQGRPSLTRMCGWRDGLYAEHKGSVLCIISPNKHARLDGYAPRDMSHTSAVATLTEPVYTYCVPPECTAHSSKATYVPYSFCNVYDDSVAIYDVTLAIN